MTWLADACDDVKCGAFLLAALRQPVNVNILIRSGCDHRRSMSWSGIDRRSERWRWSWPLVSGHWDWTRKSIDQWLERLLLLTADSRWEELVCRSSEISFISFFCPRLWPLSCERPAGGSSYTWTSSPTALPHLRRLPTSSWKPARLLWSSSPNTLALDSRFPKTFQAGTGRIWGLCFNRSVWFLRQPVRAMIEYFIFKYKKHLFCKFRESWILSGL